MRWLMIKSSGRLTFVMKRRRRNSDVASAIIAYLACTVTALALTDRLGLTCFPGHPGDLYLQVGRYTRLVTLYAMCSLSSLAL